MKSITLLLLTAAAALAQDLSGDWIAMFSLLDQKGYERVVMKQTGAKLEGKSGDATFTGSISGANVILEGERGKMSGVLKNGEIVGKAIRGRDELDMRMYREKPRPATPTTHTFEPKEFHRLFSGAIAPVLTIQPGDTVKTWAVDAGGFDAAGKKRSNGGNPQTGPFYIEGALPGDQLVVKLNRIRLNRDTAISGGRIAASALNPWYNADLERVKGFNSDWVLDRERLVGRLKEPTEKLKNFTIPLRPMLGCVGVAPSGGMAFRTGFPGSFGGNMDYNEIREGVTLYLPVYQAGALLFVGDGHAAQGDGELTGDALETSMDIEFTVDVVRGGARGQNGPRVENDEYIMAMGIAGSLDTAFQTATTELARWVARDYGLNSSEVAVVLGSSIRYDIAEVVDPLLNVVAKISKKTLAQLKK
jgi:acetamidase/formamidase